MRTPITSPAEMIGGDGSSGCHNDGSQSVNHPNNRRMPNNNRTNNNNSSGCQPNNSNNSLFYADLRKRLNRLGFQPFHNCVLLWLGAKGYRNICVLRRSSARGRRPIGGADFIAEFPHQSGVKVAIQVRYWKTPVQRRAVDELIGVMVRKGISKGLMVTNSRFYSRAIAAASESDRPIQLVSVAQLAGSMAALGLGVEPTDNGWSISESFFRTLGQLRLASSLANPPMNQRPSLFGFRSVNVDGLSVTPPRPPYEPRLLWQILLALVLLILIGLCLGSGGPR